MALETLSENKAFGGVQGVYSHTSAETGTPMTFAVYVPPHEDGAKLPVLWYLSGLTCTHANVMEKGEYRAACAEHGIIFAAPDTSPRGDDVPDASDEYDFGKGAGFYLDATQQPWAKHYRMRSYIERELPEVLAANFPVADMDRQSIMGHSMGGLLCQMLAARGYGKAMLLLAPSPPAGILPSTPFEFFSSASIWASGATMASGRLFIPAALTAHQCVVRR